MKNRRILEKTTGFDIKCILGEMIANVVGENEYKEITGGTSIFIASNDNGK